MRGLSPSIRFSRKELYRLKPPKFRVRGTPKKPDKIPKNGQIFYPKKLSEYVHVFCRNTIGTCLKSVSKSPTFRFFRDFLPLKGLFHTSSKMANFDQFLAKMGKTVKIIKKALGTFFSRLQALTVKFQKKVMSGFREKASRKNGRTDKRDS